jgi:AcrR family transcriptional regulator
MGIVNMAKAQKPYHRGDLRQRLIDGALAALEMRTVEQLSLRELAKQLEVSHNAPYMHFADKEALLTAIAAQGFERLRAELEPGTWNGAVSELRRVALAYVRLMTEHPGYLRVMFAAIDHRGNPTVEVAAGATFDALVAIVARGQADAELRANIDPRRAAGLVWMSMHGLCVILANDGTDPEKYGCRDVPDMADGFMALLCAGLV